MAPGEINEDALREARIWYNNEKLRIRAKVAENIKAERIDL